MDSDIINIFKKASYHPESRLSDGILLSILDKKKRNTYTKLWIYGTMGALSFVGLIPAIKLLISDFTQSGFYEYISMISFDRNILFGWKEVILSLTLVFMFMLTLRLTTQNIKVRINLLAV